MNNYNYSNNHNKLNEKYKKLKEKYYKDISILKQEILYLKKELNKTCVYNYNDDIFVSPRKSARVGVYVNYI